MPDIAELYWEGDSHEVLRSFPVSVRHDLGYALYQVQLGQVPVHTRPMQSIGQGVFEIREQDDRAWYRVIYLKKIGQRVLCVALLRKTIRQDMPGGTLKLPGDGCRPCENV